LRSAAVALRRFVDTLEDKLLKVDPNARRHAGKEIERKYGESEHQCVQLCMELDNRRSLSRAVQQKDAARASPCIGVGTETLTSTHFGNDELPFDG
jgi:hypothetical protein